MPSPVSADPLPRTCQVERGEVRAGLLGKDHLLGQAETSSDPGYGSEEEGAEVAQLLGRDFLQSFLQRMKGSL